jgi:hypothetical protein
VWNPSLRPVFPRCQNFCRERHEHRRADRDTGTFGGHMRKREHASEVKDVIQSAVIMSSDGKLDRLDAKALVSAMKIGGKIDRCCTHASIRLRKDDINALANVSKFLTEKEYPADFRTIRML